MRTVDRGEHDEMSEPQLTGSSKTCPFCGVSLLGAEIPEQSREHYGGQTHFSRVIGVYSQERDRTVAWRCPDCGKESER